MIHSIVVLVSSHRSDRSRCVNAAWIHMANSSSVDHHVGVCRMAAGGLAAPSVVRDSPV